MEFILVKKSIVHAKRKLKLAVTFMGKYFMVPFPTTKQYFYPSKYPLYGISKYVCNYFSFSV
jgi:hypothetical protein